MLVLALAFGSEGTLAQRYVDVEPANEYDALPGLSQQGDVVSQAPLVAGAPGRGCGHNQQGPAAVSAVLALKAAMEEFGISGTIKVFGGPADETLISRVYMARDHLFDDLDAVLTNHLGAQLSTRYGVGGNAIFSTMFSFKGQTAHSASPWTARSALDAVEIMNVATNYLREFSRHLSRAARSKLWLFWCSAT